MSRAFDHVAEEYDRAAAEYQASKHRPWRRDVERYTLFSLLPGVGEASVVDLACGEGIYSRQLRRLGARRVVGVDISAEMVALAREREAAEPLGVEYAVTDVADFRPRERFDVAFACYLLCYARTTEELRALTAATFRTLRPDGLFIGMTDNPDNDPASYGEFAPYGFVKTGLPAAERAVGAPIGYRFLNDDGTVCEITNYLMPVAEYEAAFAAAGYVDLEFVPLRLDPAAPASEPGHWDALLAHSPVIGLRARRPAGDA